MPNRRNKKKNKENVPSPGTPVVHKVPTPQPSPLEAREGNKSEPTSPRHALREPLSERANVEEAEPVVDAELPEVPLKEESQLDIKEAQPKCSETAIPTDPDQYISTGDRPELPRTYRIGYNFGFVNVKRKLTHREMLILLKDKNVVSIEKAVPINKEAEIELKTLEPLFTGKVELIPLPKDKEKELEDLQDIQDLQKLEILFHRMPFARRDEMIGFCEYAVDILKPMVNRYILKKCMVLVDKANKLNLLHNKMKYHFVKREHPKNKPEEDLMKQSVSQAGSEQGDEEDSANVEA